MWQHFTDRQSIGLATNEIEGGWTFSLTSALGQFLQELQDRYGLRDHSWTILGIEFGGDRPGIWFPRNVGNVAIRLSDRARGEPRRALYQLAHEAVHLLSPTPGKGRVIEEGLAVLYEREMVIRHDLSMYNDSVAYNTAADLTQHLLDTFGISLIKKIRSEEPTFDRWTPALLQRYGVADGLSSVLCTEFPVFESAMSTPAPAEPQG